MKLAFFSPLNPQPSGISDYSEELLPYLAQAAEIDLFVDGFRPANPWVLQNFQCFDYQSNPQELTRLLDYDAILYHLGNDHRYHSGMIRVMRDSPGIVVFHDFAFQDLFLGLAHQERDPALYLDELQTCNGKVERARAEEFFRRGSFPPQAESPLSFPLNNRLAQNAEGIIVHSNWSRERLAKIAPGVSIRRINHHITAEAAAATPKNRNHLGTVQIASFGLVTPEKGIERAFRALALLRDHDFHYTLVGPTGNFPELPELVKRYELSDRVSIAGQVSLEEFQARIDETDIAINLRERPVGATSGSLCRIMAAGVPAIVSNVGAFSELPNDAVVKIDRDEYEDAMLREYLRALIENGKLRQRIGQNARSHVLSEHRIESSASSYISFIEEVVAIRPRKQLLARVAGDLTDLGIDNHQESLLRNVAAQVGLIAPTTTPPAIVKTPTIETNVKTLVSGNGDRKLAPPQRDPVGRLPKLEGIDYKRAALEYPRKITPERLHHLRTKPFYNLANKPARYTGEGMDQDTHRHFADFANMAVTLALPVGSSILDLGCGSGWLSEYFARLGYDVTGIDISDDLIRMASERVERLPYKVDPETPVRCRFMIHDIELAPLKEKFDAIICYDSLHHLQDERAVFRHLASMLRTGGQLFILEGRKPEDNSQTAGELADVMREFGTLESPFSGQYLHELLDQNGFAVVGDYVSINGLFEREMLEGSGADRSLPLRTLDTDYHYLTCVKVADDGPASAVPNSYHPHDLKAQFTYRGEIPSTVSPETILELPISITNTGDTLWMNGQTVRAGVVMPGVRIFDSNGEVVMEFHGQPMLPRAVAPGQSIALKIRFAAPSIPGHYTIKIDLVVQHVCWFEEKGSSPIVLGFEVKSR